MDTSNLLPIRGEERAPAIVAFAKHPRLERVKTRLAASIGATSAVTIYEAMLKDTLSNLNLDQRVIKYIATSTSLKDKYFLDLAEEYSCRLLEQQGGDLGERMLNCIEQLGNHHNLVIIVGTDAPILPMDGISQGIADRENWDVMLGPTFDGGYYLIGMHHPQPELFSRIAWSTGTVLSQTRSRCLANKLRIRELPAYVDVDDRESLQCLAKILDTFPQVAPRTAQCCREFGILI